MRRRSILTLPETKLPVHRPKPHRVKRFGTQSVIVSLEVMQERSSWTGLSCPGSARQGEQADGEIIAQWRDALRDHVAGALMYRLRPLIERCAHMLASQPVFAQIFSTG